MTPGKQGFFCYNCHPPWQHMSSSQGQANYFTTRKQLEECSQLKFCRKHFCFYTLSSQLWVWRQQRKSAQLRACTQKLERNGVWSSIKPRQKHQFSLERGHGSHSRSWKLTQLKYLTLLWSFTLYIQINPHHDFALLAQELTLINCMVTLPPATSWHHMNFDDQMQ